MFWLFRTKKAEYVPFFPCLLLRKVVTLRANNSYKTDLWRISLRLPAPGALILWQR